jgi:hypothetical protein
MKQPLSLHISGPNGRRDGLGEWLAALKAISLPAPVLYSVNMNLAEDIRRYSPETKWIFRVQNETFNRLPGGFFEGDPRTSARRWLTETKDNAGRTQLQTLQLNAADWSDLLSEPVPGTVAQAQWLNEWMLEALTISNQYGMKLALFSFATGSPEYGLWSHLIPALQLGKMCGAVLSLHSYNDGGLAERDAQGRLTAAAVNNTFRHWQIYDDLPENARLPVVYSEASMGNGFGTGESTTTWLMDLIECGLMDKNDPWVLGRLAYQCGGSESNCYQVLPAYSAAIAATDWSTEPIEPPEDEESHSGKFSGFDSVILDADGAAWYLDKPRNADAGFRVMRDDVQFAGGYAEALLYWQGAVYCTNAQADWFKATESGWEQVSGDPRTMATPPEADVLLNVPWVGQNTPANTDDYSNSDCGPAAVCMWLRSRGVTVSVDDVSRATGKPAGYTYTVFADLDRAANRYGLDLRHMFGTVTLAGIREQIDAGRPAILLVHYQSLPEKWDLGYNASHWILVVGYSTDGFLYHDSYWPTEAGGKYIPITDEQLNAALTNVTKNGNKAYQGAYETVSAPPVSAAWRGLHLRADGHSTAADFECLRVAKLNAGKFMTNTGFDELDALIAAGIPASQIVLRLFAAGDNPALRNSAQFFSEQRGWLDKFASMGGRYVEIHNEPNHPSEGMGTAWPTAFAFGGWYEGVARLIRSNFPQLLIGWPGLWPDAGSAPDFITAMKASINIGLVDWIGAHSYWGNAAGVDDPANGRWYRRLLGLGKPVIITEFSNNQPWDSDQIKGAQYKRYYATLEQGVLGAFAFVSSASNTIFDEHRETWVRGGQLCAIPGVVGA